MNLNGKRTLLVAIALSTFFAAALSYSKGRNRWNMRMVTITPTKGNTETKPIDAPAPTDDLLPCRTAVMSIATHFEVEAQWASGGSSKIAVPYLKNGGTAKLNCMNTVPRLLTSYNDEIIKGEIDIKCVDGALEITKATCEGKSVATREAEAEAARKAEEARIAEEKRKADEAAAAEAARIAAEQAAAAAAAAAAAPCPQNCGGGTGTWNSPAGGKNTSGYSVSWQACNSGHKIVRSSGNSNVYAVGACYNSIPK